ncbi:hypothetical protein M9H77_12941 [Catharanthus roseus]|uniref:Uncharacterized protein n=1 Tax=Catharanthus roseus TaxID=4058 RepID=A0ACC0BIU4_CATRO|nr:hypothetical protein M9H77_12941 [Catharanthus roseus]
MAENSRTLREYFTHNTYNSSIGLEVKTQILDSHTQSIAKLETYIVQLANTISRRDEGKLSSHPIENPIANYHEQTKAKLPILQMIGSVEWWQGLYILKMAPSVTLCVNNIPQLLHFQYLVSPL